MVQGDQNGGGIGTSAAQTGAGGDAFVNADIDAPTDASMHLQKCRRAHREVRLRRDVQSRKTLDAAVSTRSQVDLIAKIQELKTGLQLVITVSTASENMQKQIDLGRRRPAREAHIECGRRRAHGSRFQ